MLQKILFQTPEEKTNKTQNNKNKAERNQMKKQPKKREYYVRFLISTNEVHRI